MKKILLIGLALFALAACKQDDDHSKHGSQQQVEAEQTYICPMHPHIKGHKGDTCPICNMYLEPVANNNTDTNTMHHQMQSSPKHCKHHTAHTCKADKSLATQLSTQQIDNANIKTTAVLFGQINEAYKAFSKVVSQNKIVQSISMRDNGWVESIANIDEYSYVKKGEFLFSFYSPEIKSAQIDYIIALKENSKSQIASSKVRLENLGVQKEVIEQLNKTRAVQNAINFYAPIDGYVKQFNINKGKYVKLGENAVTIQSESSLWLDVYVPANKVHLSKNATSVKILNDNSSIKFNSILPMLDSSSQDYIFRFELDNSKLKEGQFAEVLFDLKSEPSLYIPTAAVIKEGMQNYVYVKHNDHFMAKKVELGYSNKDYTIIKSGLEKSELIVTSGQFLVDSQAKLTSDMSGMDMSMHNH